MAEYHYSALNSYAQCARRAKYQYRDRLEPIKPQYGLILGTDLHAIAAAHFVPNC